jgi:transcription antitermination protein NusB
MLNRRIIRGKTLQQIFAYKTCIAANAEIIKENIIAHFQPDLNSLEVQDIILLQNHSKLALNNFDEFLKNNSFSLPSNLPLQVKTHLNKSIIEYQNANSADLMRIIRKMVEDSEQLTEYYALILKLAVELKDNYTAIKKKSTLSRNFFIAEIEKNEALKKTWSRNNLSWSQEQQVLGEVINQLSSNKDFIKYAELEQTNFDEDKSFVIYLFKNIIFKSPHLNEYFENLQLNWQEDQVAIKDMVVETLKEITPNSTVGLANISKNWEEDKNFMKDLFNKTIESESYIESLLIPKLQNWDISRLTATDSILMKLCLTEMLYFQNIPVKVSLNEYIEISKKYSTPKSKTLINGVLDSISTELLQNGLIKKSGRGLLDNK